MGTDSTQIRPPNQILELGKPVNGATPAISSTQKEVDMVELLTCASLISQPELLTNGRPEGLQFGEKQSLRQSGYIRIKCMYNCNIPINISLFIIKDHLTPEVPKMR